jgi:iron complex outermembrane receptor protein
VLSASLLFAGAALAQSGPINVDIAAQPLDKALGALARQSGARIVFSTELTEKTNAPTVRGSLTVPQALERLLAGSGLVLRSTADGGFTVVSAQDAPNSQLPPVTVTAESERETATSPVLGYFARRSSTATKTDTPIIETPQSVSVVTRQQLDDQRPASLVEALEYSPGVFTGQIGATNRYDYLPLRGFIETSTDNTVLDGLKVLSDGGSYSSMQVEPYLLERIDVYRGPSSVLYGRNAPGGLVAMTSKRPTTEPSHELELTLGNHERRQLGIDLAGPVGAADSGLSYRITGMARENHTQYDYVKESRYAIAPSLQYQPDGRTRVLLQAYLQKDPEGGYHGGVPADGTVTTTHNGQRIPLHFFEGDPNYNAFSRTQRMFGYQAEHQFDNGWTARQNFRYLSSSVHLEQVYAYGWSGPNTLTRYTSGANEKLNAWTIDNQLQREFQTGAARHTFLAGLDYQRRQVTGTWTSGSATDIDVFNPSYGNALVGSQFAAAVDRKLSQTGVYLQDQLAWGGWRMTLSGRWDQADTGNLAYGTTDVLSWSGSKFSKRAGLLYLFDNGLAPYASYSESFNPSGFTDAKGQVLSPTESTQVEVGLKYEPAGGVGMASIAAFNLEQDNVATRTLGTPFYEPAGKVRSRGVEAEARLQLSRGFALLASYTFTDAEFLRGESATQGKTPYQVPRQMASLWGDYALSNGITLGAGLRYIGPSWADNANTLQVGGYDLIDLALRFDLRRLRQDWQGASVRINVKNLADKRYVASCASLNYCYYGETRRISATLGYQW